MICEFDLNNRFIQNKQTSRQKTHTHILSLKTFSYFCTLRMSKNNDQPNSKEYLFGIQIVVFTTYIKRYFCFILIFEKWLILDMGQKEMYKVSLKYPLVLENKVTIKDFG